MQFVNIILILTVTTLAFAEVEDVHIDDSKFGPLEPPDSPAVPKVVAHMTDFTDIQAISNAIKNFQKNLEEEHNYLPTMQAYLTTNTASNEGKEFELSSILTAVLYSEQVTDNINISLPSINEPLVNVTAVNSTKIVNCTNFVPSNQTEISVEVVNSTRLVNVLQPNPEITNRRMAGICSLVLFYAKSCQFSALAAPHFNILPKIFPQVKMVAFNALSEQRFKTKYGIIGVPSLILFHNGKPIAKYNGSDYTLYEFTKFVIRHTDLNPNEKIEISENDFLKPLPEFLNHDYDYSLWLAWFVIIFWALFYGRNMNFWRKFVEDIKNIWQEAEAQHEHTD